MDTQLKPNGLSRRDTFKLMGIAGTAAALGRAIPSLAQDLPAATPPPKAMPQGAGFYRTHVGDFEITIISDGGFALQPYPTFGANASEQAVTDVLAQSFLTLKDVWGQVNTVLVKREGGPLILVDTGCGKNFGPAAGFALQNLQAAGVRPEDIEVLLLTHLHPDHVGGAVGADGKLVFPNAKVMTHQVEYDFWNSPSPDFSKSGVPEANQAGMIAAAKKLIDTVGRGISLFNEDTTTITTGLTAIHTGGHTPGHCTLIFDSGGEKLVYLTDLAICAPIVFPHPEWYVAFDTDRDATVQIRKNTYATVAADRTLISGSHLPFPSLGHVKKIGDDSYQYVPAPWRWA